MEEKVEKLLREICFTLKVEGRRVLKDFGLTPAQFDILQKIFFAGPKRITELCAIIGVAKSTISGLVKRLEEMGYLKREPDLLDKRAQILELTEKGAGVIERVIERRVAFVREVLANMDERRVSTMMELLETLRKIMEERKTQEKE